MTDRLEAGPARIALAVFVAVLLSGVLMLVGPLIGEARAYTGSSMGIADEPRINELIYPSFGNPAIIKSGGQLTIEFDPRKGAWGLSFNNPLYNSFTNFAVEATSSNSTEVEPQPNTDVYRSYPITRTLPLAQFEIGYSTHWPEYAYKPDQDRRMYVITVNIPSDLPPDLYNLKVTGTRADMSTKVDSEPHALQVVPEYKDRFSIVQLSDIHVFGPECDYPSSNHKERSNRTNTYTTANGYGAPFYHKAIEQINRMKPDIVIYTGDYDFNQAYWTKDSGTGFGECAEAEYELLWFYQETLKLQVPVYITLGNHDGYNWSTTFDAPFNEDWKNDLRKLFGPLYFSYDYGEYHFLSLDSVDWASAERTLQLWDFMGIIQIMQPVKYKGQLRGQGDNFVAGATEQQFNNINVNNLTGQLGWMRDDLAAHQSAKMRICSMHHDPWKDNGSGAMWSSAEGGEGGFIDEMMNYFGQFMNMGNGQGRIAVMRLMRQYNVAIELSGHDHSDYYGTLPWAPYGAGGGEVKFANTTSTSFQADGDSGSYPGYRKVWINDGVVESTGYTDGNPLYSYPFYDGCTIGGTTNLHNLSTPAIETSWNAQWPWNSNDVTATVTNHLSKPLTGDGQAYLEFNMPYQANSWYYGVTGGSFATVYDTSQNPVAGSDHRICQVYAPVNAGQAKAVRVYRVGQDLVNPQVDSFQINGGAATTPSVAVTLDISASDNIGPGMVKDMMISNKADFSGASWEPYTTTRDWNLEGGDNGPRTVYIKVRDMAMPANQSATGTDTINYQKGSGPSPDDPQISSITPTWAVQGTGLVNVTVSAKNTHFVDGRSRVHIGGQEAASTTTIGSELVQAQVWAHDGIARGSYDVNVITDSENPYPLKDGFTITGPPPTISNINPEAAAVGAEVVIYGNEFGTQDAHCKVKFNGTEATRIVSWGDSEIRCEVPTGATTGPVKVTTLPGTSNGVTFTVTSPTPVGSPPRITGISPNSGAVGSEVSLTGTHFGATKGQYSKVSFNGADVGSSDLVSWSDTNIKVRVPKKAESGNVTVATEAGASNGKLFTVTSSTPVIPTEPAKKWYLAEGSTMGGFETWILVQNPNKDEVNVKLDYLTKDGPVEGPSAKIPGNSRMTFFAADTVPNQWDVSTIVTTDKPTIVERSVYWANRKGGHDSTGVTEQSKTWYLAEGSTNGGFETWVLLANAGTRDATVQLTYMTDTGVVDGPEVKLDAKTRTSINVADTVPNTWSVSTKITSTKPILAERSVYWGNRMGGHEAIGVTSPATVWYLAEGSTNGGFESWVLVQNPGSKDANVQLTYMTDKGEVEGPLIEVKAGTRQTLNVADTVPNTWDVSTKVTADRAVIAERAVYWQGYWNDILIPRIEGHDSIGVTAPTKTWYLAEGSTNGGFETWVLVQNPNTEKAVVTLEYMTANGPVTGPTVEIEPNSRKSFFVADTVPNEWSVSTKVTSDRTVNAERAVYWGNKQGGHDSIGVPQ